VFCEENLFADGIAFAPSYIHIYPDAKFNLSFNTLSRLTGSTLSLDLLSRYLFIQKIVDILFIPTQESEPKWSFAFFGILATEFQRKVIGFQIPGLSFKIGIFMGYLLTGLHLVLRTLSQSYSSVSSVKFCSSFNIFFSIFNV
jgi:hypothetical protein